MMFWLVGRSSIRMHFISECVTGAAILILLLIATPPTVEAVSPKPAWRISLQAQPTTFAPGNPAICSNILAIDEEHCESYVLVVRNVGGKATSGLVNIHDTLPPGISFVGTHATVPLVCHMITSVECTMSQAVLPGKALLVRIYVKVEPGASTEPEGLKSKATVEGGGAESKSVNYQNEVNAASAPFGIANFGFEVNNFEGETDVQAGDHPYGVTTSISFPTLIDVTGSKYVRVDQEKNIIVDLPAGFVGNPTATPQCAESSLATGVNGGGLSESECLPDSQIGTVTLELAINQKFGINSNTGYEQSGSFPVYNITPDRGYPAEFGFNFDGQPVVFYASPQPMVHDGTRFYGLRAMSPGVIRGLGVDGVSLTFWGTPGESVHTPLRQVQREYRGSAPGTGSSQAFLTNPTTCSTEPLEATVYVDSWDAPGTYVNKSVSTYPELMGCNMLQFQSSIGVRPEKTQADEPSGYGVSLDIPQSPNEFPDVATPQLKDATVTLPPGVSLSPAAAAGLVGCQATGPEGINVGSTDLGPEGRDFGDPEATELGAGHLGGNNSPYDDGLYHPAPGHCPAASTLGTVEVETPLLPAHALTGRVFVAQPSCGGSGQRECTEAAAETGGVFGLYLEIKGEGVIVKLPGKVEVGGQGRLNDLQPGQVRTTFAEDPQLPFSELKLKLKGGARAPLANPQTCGVFTTTSDLTPWSAPITPDATPSSSFAADWDGAGGVCPANLPFAPGLSAGTVSPAAGGYSPFTLTLSRHDREQDLAGVSVTMPAGLLGKIAGIPQCGEAEANAGTCSAASRIGSATAAAGAGSLPFWQSGQVYLTGPYKGAPFGLSVVVPAKAGPFNLGNIVVRARIEVNSHTSQLTVVSDPLPQSVDGVPLRLQTINVTTDRPEFMFNPTNCNQQQVSATVGGSGGASANVSSPFAVGGCAGLPFKPSFAVSTQAKTSKAAGASLAVKVGSGAGQANIAKVHVTLPKQLPARLSTLQKACTDTQFNVNPAGCPAASVVGTAVARTPVLNIPLTGPAYLVSHGGVAFPDLVIVLQGEGITLYLDGNTNIKKGITTSTFNSVPDAPISTFALTLPEGAHSVLTTDIAAKAKGSMCGLSLKMPTTITGQNGAVVTQPTKIRVTGCPKAKKVKAKARKGKKKGGKK